MQKITPKVTLKIVPPQNSNDYTHYFLDDIGSTRKIEIFVLKYYLEQKLSIKFGHRTIEDYY